MISLFGKINKSYGSEFVLFHKVRDFSDGLTFFEFEINWDRYLGDHNPSFEIALEIFNFMIFEFNIYYLFHRQND